MIKALPFILRLISNGLAPLTLTCAVIAFYQPSVFLIFKPYFLWLFAASMFSLGVVLKPDELKTTLKTPQTILLGVCTQYSSKSRSNSEIVQILYNYAECILKSRYYSLGPHFSAFKIIKQTGNILRN